jgi:hypothetical protein
MGEREIDVKVGDGVAGGSFSPLELEVDGRQGQALRT